jgi:glutamine amidotransferase-like uncharacterized protein
MNCYFWDGMVLISDVHYSDYAPEYERIQKEKVSVRINFLNWHKI